MKVIIIIAIVAGYFFVSRLTKKFVLKMGEDKSVDKYRVNYINKTLSMIVTAIFVAILFLFLGIQFSQLSVFISSIFAVIGVALFAQWSILSNITASLIIFFFFPYRVGYRVKVVDGDADISGIIEEITLFHVMIRKGQDIITYPNNLILQKAVIKIAAEDELETVQDA